MLLTTEVRSSDLDLGLASLSSLLSFLKALSSSAERGGGGGDTALAALNCHNPCLTQDNTQGLRG